MGRRGLMDKSVDLSTRCQGSRVRLPVSPSFLRECPEEKSREKSSRIVNERERDDVDIRSTGGKDDGEEGMRIRNGYENWFGSSRKRTIKWLTPSKE